jgi:hypothetical protein
MTWRREMCHQIRARPIRDGRFRERCFSFLSAPALDAPAQSDRRARARGGVEMPPFSDTPRVPVTERVSPHALDMESRGAAGVLEALAACDAEMWAEAHADDDGRRGPSRPVPPDGRGRHRAARARGLAVRRERHARDPRGGAGGRVRHERAAGVPVRARRGAVAESGARNERPRKKESHLSARHRGGRRGAFSERGVVRGRPRARRERFPKSRGGV